MEALAQSRVGRSEVFVSRLGVGGGTLANAGGSRAVDDLLEACWTAGLRSFDTAPLYANGESEQRFGRFFSRHPRHDFTVSTKVGRYPAPPGTRRFDYSADATRRSIELSLQRMGLDFLDIVLIHDINREMHCAEFDRQYARVVDECFPVLSVLKNQGVIRSIGLSTRQTDVCLSAAADMPLDCLMMPGSYTLLHHEPLAELFPTLLDKEISVLSASVYNSGILATGNADSPFQYGKASSDVVARVERIMQRCRQHGVSIATAALRFAASHPVIASVVVGQQSISELDANLAAMNATLPAELWHDLAADGLIPPSALSQLLHC